MNMVDDSDPVDLPSPWELINFADASHRDHGHQCYLLGGFGLLVQCVLAVSIFSSLLIKWALEGHPRIYRFVCCTKNPPEQRTFTVFALDISKQIISSTVAHILNITQALFLRNEHFAHGANQCVWYLIGVSGDCFASTFLACSILTVARPILLKYYAINIGEYDQNDGSFSPGAWFQQTVLWCIIILQVRLVLLIVVYVLRGPLYSFGHDLLNPLDVKSQLVAVLVVVPLIGNNVQFLIQDTFLRSKKKPEGKV